MIPMSFVFPADFIVYKLLGSWTSIRLTCKVWTFIRTNYPCCFYNLVFNLCFALPNSWSAGYIFNKGAKEISIGAADDCRAVCNGLWCLYLLTLFKASQHPHQVWIFKCSGDSKALSTS